MKTEGEFTHFDDGGNAVMVDVSGKDATERTAMARGTIRMSSACFRAVREGKSKKGDVLGVARIAGIMGAKRTSELIPLCHMLALTKAELDFELYDDTCEIEASCTVKTRGRTGVEMEALTGVSVALLTIYDMCKAIDKEMVIEAVYLDQKSGGKSGVVQNGRLIRNDPEQELV